MTLQVFKQKIKYIYAYHHFNTDFSVYRINIFNLVNVFNYELVIEALHLNLQIFPGIKINTCKHVIVKLISSP